MNKLTRNDSTLEYFIWFHSILFWTTVISFQTTETTNWKRVTCKYQLRTFISWMQWARLCSYNVYMCELFQNERKRKNNQEKKKKQKKKLAAKNLDFKMNGNEWEVQCFFLYEYSDKVNFDNWRCNILNFLSLFLSFLPFIQYWYDIVVC